MIMEAIEMTLRVNGKDYSVRGLPGTLGNIEADNGTRIQFLFRPQSPWEAAAKPQPYSNAVKAEIARLDRKNEDLVIVPMEDAVDEGTPKQYGMGIRFPNGSVRRISDTFDEERADEWMAEELKGFEDRVREIIAEVDASKPPRIRNGINLNTGLSYVPPKPGRVKY